MKGNCFPLCHLPIIEWFISQLPINCPCKIVKFLIIALALRLKQLRKYFTPSQ